MIQILDFWVVSYLKNYKSIIYPLIRICFQMFKNRARPLLKSRRIFVFRRCRKKKVFEERWSMKKSFRKCVYRETTKVRRRQRFSVIRTNEKIDHFFIFSAITWNSLKCLMFFSSGQQMHRSRKNQTFLERTSCRFSKTSPSLSTLFF